MSVGTGRLNDKDGHTKVFREKRGGPSCGREGRLNSTRGQCLESEIGPNQFEADKTRVVVTSEVFA